MALGRYLTHAVVLVVAMLVASFASVDRNLPTSFALRLGAVNAEGLVGGEGGSVGTVSLGRTSTIIKPIAVPTAAPKPHTASVYTVGDGDSLASLAARFGVSESAIRWSNYSLLKRTDSNVAAGQQLVIPPIEGVVVTIQDGDTAASLASKYQADPQAIVDFNYLRDPVSLPAGVTIVIPGGKGPDFEKPPAPPPAPIRTTYAAPRSSGTGYAVSAGGPAAGGYGNRFAYGYCTWYVASRIPVPWLGNAWEWFGQAQAYGWATGQTPRAGAIMVTWESGYGHVAIVERVNPDGSWTVSEMNFVGWGVVDQRTIAPGHVPLIGFIYH
ncbi:MAG TPA: CHAP domain-containing protein [Candidatus Dormibacteraeota bacterium]